MDEIMRSIKGGLVGLFTDSSFINLLISALSLILLSFFKRVRERIIIYCKDTIARFRKKPHCLDKTYTQQYDLIRADLYKLLYNGNAIRASIWQFHNGNKFVLADPIFKLSCSHECVANGLTFDSGIIRDIIVSNLIDFVGPLLDSERTGVGVKALKACDKYKEENTDAACGILRRPLRIVKFTIDEMPYSHFKYLMEVQGTKQLYAIPLYAKSRNQPIGIICLQYGSKDNEQFFAKNICSICDIVLRVQFLLDGFKSK